MQDRPRITTAIPRQRYRIGRYAAILLGEVESGDGRAYRHLVAFVRQGSAQPDLYVYAEEASPGERSGGRFRLRLVSEALSETLDTGDGWADLDLFVEQALALGIQTLGLGRERVERLM